MKLGALRAEIRRSKIVLIHMRLPDGEILLPVIKDSLFRVLAEKYGLSRTTETHLTLLNGHLRLTTEFTSDTLSEFEFSSQDAEEASFQTSAPSVSTEPSSGDPRRAWRRGFLAGVIIGTSLDEAAERDASLFE
jgi:hypothetical protein